jgi:PAS domain S-box-containing protein
MQILTKRFGVVAGFVVMLALLLLSTISIRHQLANQVTDHTWVDHTRRVLLEISRTESLLKDAETGQRGFLYTGDPAYLAPYQQALGEIPGQLNALAASIGDNSEQQARVVRLRVLVSKKLEEAAHTVALAQSGRSAEAKAIVLSDTGKETMDSIRRLMDQMDREEDRLDAARTSSYKASVRATVLSIYLASVIGVLGLILLGYYILHEMALRQRHANQLLQREEWFRVTLTSLGDAVIATDAEGAVTYLNPLAEDLIGLKLPEVKGQRIEQVFPIFNEQTHERVENPVAKVMEQGVIVGLANHTVLQHRDGRLIPIEDSAAPIRDSRDNLIGVVLVFRDATQERKTQETLRESEKLAAAARMSATVAHEINNPLEAVGNLIYLAKRTLAMPPDAAEYLDVAEQELERVSHIARKTLGFYREFRVPEMIDIEELIEYVLRMHANRLEAKRIHLDRQFGHCPRVKGLPGELKQAVSNLISNAAEAVDYNGTVRVKLGCVDMPAGTFIQIWVEDNGPGIAREYRERIFEPFFTTKKDVGTGLGLWLTKEIIDRHKGTIDIPIPMNGSLGGAVFNVLLPVEQATTASLP